MPQVPSDYMSFSTFYNKDYNNNTQGGKRRGGPRKVSCFELLNFMTGRSIGTIFDVRGKKKDILQQSPFPKKKQPFKIGMNPGMDSGGAHQRNFFFSKEQITTIFDSMLEEMTKFQDPIIIPESQIFRLIATYYRVKPSVGSGSQSTLAKGGASQKQSASQFKSPKASLRVPTLQHGASQSSPSGASPVSGGGGSP